MSTAVSVPRPGLLRFVALAPAALVPLAALTTAISGGFYGASWYPVAILLAGALVVVLVSERNHPLGRIQRFALSAAVLFAGWSYVSIAWAGLPGSALTEANRAATYAIAVAIVLLVADTPTRRRDLTAIIGLSCAALALYAIGSCAIADDFALFDDGRMYGPIGYPNAVSMFAMAGLWPLVTLAASHDEPVWLRAVALGSAAAIPATTLLTVSRAGVLFAILGAIAFFAASPIRVRGLVAAVAVLAPSAVAWSTLRQPWAQDVPTLGAVHDAGFVALAGVAAAGVFGVVWAMLDRRIVLPARVGGVVRGILGIACVAAVAVGAVVAVQRDAPHVVSKKWEAFTQGSGSDADPTADRLLTVGTNRYDFWRVAIAEAKARPVLGYGAGNWSWPYLAKKRSYETPDNAHGAIWEFAADLGLPGLALYVGLIGLTFVAALAPGARDEWPRQASLFAALVVTVGHQQVDWLWETFPTGLMIAALIGITLAGAQRPPRGEIAPRGRRLGVACAVAVAAVGVAPALLAARFTDAAYRQKPAVAIATAKRAATLNPFAAAPQFALSDARTRAGDHSGAVDAMRDAVAREPKNWAAWLELSRVAARAGDSSEAHRACVNALHINPEVGCGGSS